MRCDLAVQARCDKRLFSASGEQIACAVAHSAIYDAMGTADGWLWCFRIAPGDKQ